MPNYKRLRSVAGFTLIELLLVIFIISILAGLTLLSVRDKRDDVLNETVELLRLRIEVGRSTAMITQQMFGIQITDNSYQFLVWDYHDKSWRVFDVEGRRSNPLPTKIEAVPTELELSVVDTAVEVSHETVFFRAVDEKNCQTGSEVKECLTAQVLIYPDGRINKFSLYLGIKGEETRAKLHASGYSKVKINYEG